MPRPVTAKVEGVSIFDCNYGVSNGRYAIKVRETLSRNRGSPERQQQ
jgi:flagellar motor switch protein FliM